MCVCVPAHEVNHYAQIEHTSIVTVGKLGQESNTHTHTYTHAHTRTHTHTHALRTRTENTVCLSLVLSFCSYAGRVVGSSFKAQRENPEMTVRNTDPVLKGAKQRLEQLTQVHTCAHFD